MERGLIAGRALWFYAAKLLVPLNLTFIYPRWAIDATAGLAISLSGRSLGRRNGPAVGLSRALGTGAVDRDVVFCRHPNAGTGLFQLLPHALLLCRGPLPILGQPGAFSAGRRRWAPRVDAAGPSQRPDQSHWRWSWPSAVCSPGSKDRIYADLETLWRDTLQKNAGAWIAHNNLANILKERGQLDQAIGHYRQALLLKPGSAQIYLNLADAHQARGESAAALRHYRRALKAEPDRVETYLKLGNALLGQNAVSEAIDHYRQALRLAPNLALAHSNLGAALAIQRQDAEAIEHYRRALQIKPDFAEAHNNLGRLLALRGQFADGHRTLPPRPPNQTHLPPSPFQSRLEALQAVGADPRSKP